MLKNISNLGKSLSKAAQKEISGGRIAEASIAEEGGYQYCNAWGCGACVTGSSEDCSGYGSEVWGQAC